jgi:acyl-CoA reductase-like NAD-dependent aldehyde dehydrogenase
MKKVMKTDTIKTITTHYIDGAYVGSHGREVMDLINPTTAQVIGRVTLGDEEDARRAIAAAKRAFATFSRSTKEERSKILRRLHEVVSARIDDMRSWRADLENGKAPAHSCLGCFGRLGRLEGKEGAYEGGCS